MYIDLFCILPVIRTFHFDVVHLLLQVVGCGLKLFRKLYTLLYLQFFFITALEVLALHQILLGLLAEALSCSSLPLERDHPRVL